MEPKVTCGHGIVFVPFLRAQKVMGTGVGVSRDVRNAIQSSFWASQALQETSQIHTMFPSVMFCLWISK